MKGNCYNFGILEIMKKYKPFKSDRLSKSEEEPNTI